MVGEVPTPSVGDRGRRLAAVWFCDVVGSTEIAAELGDRRFRWLIARYLAVARSALRRHGGREIDTAGDGMFAIFDAPATALRAAFEATAAVRDVGLEIRSGVHLGEVEQDPDRRVGGIAVHVGARVASIADPGAVLTTATTSELASGAGFGFEDRGTHALKGIAGQHAVVAVVEVDGQRAEPPLEPDEAARRRVAATAAAGLSAERPAGDAAPGERARPFVGRIRELDEVLSALPTASAGHGSLFLISGEPGIGKSRFMGTVAEHAEERGWRVLTGRCWEGGGAPAYWPWIQIVRGAGGEFADLAPVPEAAGGGSGRGRRSTASESVDPEAARFQLFDEVGRFLSDSARERPTLIVLDDLHAADEPSLLLLRFLATTVPERPILALGSYREGELRVRELADLFGDLARLGRRIPLRGLSTTEVARYIALASGDEPSDAVATRVSDVTGGNPFFIGEVVRVLVAEGRLAGADEAANLPLPEEVRALIRRRLAGLSPEAVNLLRVAAVIGRDFDLRVIAATTTLSPERIIDALAESERGGVIAEDRNQPGTYAFAHDLVRATLYEDLPTTRRMELHRTVGGELEDMFREDLEPHLAEIAHHLAQAAPIGESERAVDYSVRAADRARAVLAYEDAAGLYKRALQLLGPAEATSERSADILLRMGDVQSRAGDTEDARQSFEQAAAIARRAGDHEMLTRAALGYVTGAVPYLGFGALLLTARFGAGSRGISLLEEALDALPKGDRPLRARALARLATQLYQTEFRDPRLSLSQEAIDMALRLGDSDALVEALRGRHWATLAPDSVGDRLSNAQQMLVAATGAGDEEAAFLARHIRVHCFLELCDVPGIDAELEAMAQLADRIRQPFYLWHTACLRGVRSLLEGRLGHAERQMRDALEIARVRESEYVFYMFEYAQLVALRWTQGRLEEVRDRIEHHGERFRGIPRWRDALAAAELGDDRWARAEVERHARNGFADLPRDGLWILHLCGLAEAAVLLRDEPRAAELYELLAPFADRNAVSISTMPFGPVATRLGMLATLLERWGEAEKQFEGAMEMCEAMGARAIEARVLVEHARMLLARRGAGDDGRAGDLLGRATMICEELDLPGIAERASALAGTAGLADAQAASGVDRGTFRREGQFWTVAYRGEIARLHDLKGLRYIGLLLAAPGRDVHVLELAGAQAAEPLSGDHAGTEGLHPSRLEGTEAVLDQQAKDVFRRRLAELGEELEEARSWNDPERAARVEAEIDALTSELERSLGLGGRDRGMPSPAERARVSVTKAIKAAVRAVSDDCPALGEHLAASIRTGRFCSYAPPGREPPVWDL
jgi:class 3 adenylate cyclase/tetratricopeptide (TPR) repeat protein